LRGKWKSGTVLLCSRGDAYSELVLIAEIAKILARDYHLNTLIILFKRHNALADLVDHANVVVLEDFRNAYDVFRPSALRMLVKTLCAAKPLFAICDIAELLLAIGYAGIPSYFLSSGLGEHSSKPVLESIFSAARRVIFSSSVEFNVAAQELGYHPINVALRPYDHLIPALPGNSRESTREKLIGTLGLSGEPFIVLGTDVRGGSERFNHFLSVARQVRQRMPSISIVFVWVEQQQATAALLPDDSSYPVEIERSGMQGIVFSVTEPADTDNALHAADVLFLPSGGSQFLPLLTRAARIGLPVICFEETSIIPRSSSDLFFDLPDLDIDVISDRIIVLQNKRIDEMQTLVPNRNRISSVENYVSSFINLVKRDIHLSDGILHKKAKPSPKLMKKVIIPCSDWAISGVNSALQALGQELIGLGWDVQILFTRDYSAIRQSAGYHLELPQIPYHFLQTDNPGIEGVWEALIAYLENSAPCVMLTAYDFEANSVVSALTEQVGVVTWIQADDSEYYEQAYRLGRYCNAVVCVSDRIKQRVAELNPLIGGDRAYIIHNSSVRDQDIVHEKSFDSTKLRLIYTGRLVQYQKRVLDFVDLADSLDRTGAPYQLTLIGDFAHTAHGNAEALFYTRAKGHLEDGRIVLKGRMARIDIFEQLCNHDVFLLLSDFEGLPLSVIEAMARGCVPVVAEMESGIPEIITNGENGLIVSGRVYDEWARLLIDIWKDQERLLRMSQSAREVVRKRFTVEQVGKQFDGLLGYVVEEICAEAYKRPPSLNWGAKRSPTGDVLPPPSLYTPRA
jgi:glycosyltransferase involved in cell wall biosynthesis